jgi:hypothetical protein
MGVNEFLEPRVAKAEYTVLASAGTQALTSGVYIPAAAVVTGVTLIDNDALGSVHTNDSASVDLRIANTHLSASQILCSTKSVGFFGTVNIANIWPLTSTAGVQVSSGGELVLSVQASSGTLARTWSPTIYVGYVA